MGCSPSTEKSPRKTSDNSSPLELKIAILGNGGVGKSAITYRFIQNKFSDTYNPTIEDSYRKQFVVDEQPIVLDLLDTAGQEEYKELREVYMRGGEGFIVVYSITDPKSFQEVTEFRDQAIRVKDGDKIAMILVGNKTDLEHQRVVSTQQGQQLADKLGIPFIETSARTGINCDEVFTIITREVMKHSSKKAPKAKK